MSDRKLPVGALVASAALAAGVALTVASPGPLPEAAAVPSTDKYDYDQYGYLDSVARCDDSQTLMALGRTSRALVAICVDPDGELEYRGVRLSDEAALTMPAGRASDGSIVATNDGVTYSVSPDVLLVSDGDTVLYRDAWTDFNQPRFSESTPATSSESTPATSSATSTATSTTEAPTTTVSTTTVTVTPTTSTSDG